MISTFPLPAARQTFISYIYIRRLRELYLRVFTVSAGPSLPFCQKDVIRDIIP